MLSFEALSEMPRDAIAAQKRKQLNASKMFNMIIQTQTEQLSTRTS